MCKITSAWNSTVNLLPRSFLATTISYWNWTWFNPHLSERIGPHSDATLVCWGLLPPPLPRWVLFFEDLSWWRLSSLSFAGLVPSWTPEPPNACCGICWWSIRISWPSQRSLLSLIVFCMPCCPVRSRRDCELLVKILTLEFDSFTPISLQGTTSMHVKMLVWSSSYTWVGTIYLCIVCIRMAACISSQDWISDSSSALYNRNGIELRTNACGTPRKIVDGRDVEEQSRTYWWQPTE